MTILQMPPTSQPATPPVPVNPVTIFDNPEFGSVRVVTGADGEPWFVARDVCQALCLDNVSQAVAAEAEAFRRGELHYGLFRDKGIPFVLVNFRGLASFDCYINTLIEPQAKLDTFLIEKSEANLWTFYLVDGQSTIVRGIRIIGVEHSLMADLKAECFKQARLYSSPTELSATANKIISRYSTKQLTARSRIWTLRAYE
jgi:hypothetical protein